MGNVWGREMSNLVSFTIITVVIIFLFIYLKYLEKERFVEQCRKEIDLLKVMAETIVEVTTCCNELLNEKLNKKNSNKSDKE